MTSSQREHPAATWDAAQQRRALTAWVWRTTGFSFFSATFFVYYLKEVGASDLAIGYASALPSLGMAFQFLGAVLAERAASRKRLVIGFYGLRIFLCWLPILVVGWWAAGRADRAHLVITLFILCTTLGSIAFHLHSPAWDSWFSDATPNEEKGAFFGKWGFWSAWAGGCVALAGGWVVDCLAVGSSERMQRALLGMFALGLVCTAVNWGMYFQLRDTQRQSEGIRSFSELVRAAVSEANYWRFLGAYCWHWLVIGLYLSFQFVWFKTQLRMSLTFLGLLAMLQSIVIALCSPRFGAWAQQHGAKPLFWIGIAGSVIWPLVYFGYTPSTVKWLAPLHWMAGGVFAAAGSVSINMLWYSLPSPQARTMKFALGWVLFGLAGALGAWIGGLVAQHAPPLRLGGAEFSRFHWLFLAASVAQLPCFWLLKTFNELSDRPTQPVAAWLLRRWSERRLG